MTPAARQGLRLASVVLGSLFVLSAALNLGAKVPPLTFASPSSSIAEFEIAIGAVFFVASLTSSLYAYAGAAILGVVGIAEGLLDPDVQGSARTLHEAMVPFALAALLLLVVAAYRGYRERGQGGSQIRGELVVALQFFVGGLVTLGGAAFARSGTYPVGTALGLVHLAIGLTGLFGGYVALKMKPWSKGFLISINSLIILYSAFAETLAEVYDYLPPGINDALIGTIVAIAASLAILYLLLTER